MVSGLINPGYAIAGFAVGALVGMTGVGGGSLMTPILVLFFGIDAPKAVGTDLLFASLTKTVGTSVHGWGGTVDWKIVRRLALGSIPATILTVLMLKQIGSPSGTTTRLITLTLGGALVFTGMATLFRQRIVDALTARFGTPDPRRTVTRTVILGAILGVLVSISSVGAGAIGVTALLVLYPTLPLNRVAGTDIAHAVPLTLIAGIGHWWLGSVNFALLGSLLIGSVPGIVIGSLAATRMSDGWLRPILGSVLLFVGFRMLL
jgi:uncharacterized protein